MFTLLNTNHISRAGSKNLLDTPVSQSTHYGGNSVIATGIYKKQLEFTSKNNQC